MDLSKKKKEKQEKEASQRGTSRDGSILKKIVKKSYKKSWSDELIWLGVICRGSCFLSHSRSVRIQWGWEQILHLIRTVYWRQLCRYVQRAWSCRGWQYAWMSTLLLSRKWHLFRCKIRESNAEVLILVCTNQRFQTWSTASWPFRSVEAITMARVQAQHGPDKASALSIILARHWASKSCCQFTKFRIACCLGFATCSCSLLFLCSLLLTLALLFGVMIRTSSEVPQTCPPFRSLASLSLCIRLDVYDQYWQLSVSVSVPVHASVFTEGLCAHFKATVWSYQVVTWRIPILRFEQHCSTEVSGFLATFVATSSSRTCSCIQKVWHIFAFTLPSCFQLIRHRILRFSSIQYRPALNRRFRFRSVIPNLCHRISYGMLHWDKYEFTSLAHWLDNRPHVALLQQKSNLSWADQFAPCCINLIENQTPSFERFLTLHRFGSHTQATQCEASWVPHMLLSPLFLGSMFCWCRSVSTSMTNSPTSGLRQASCLLNPQTRLCIVLEQSHKHFLNVLNQSPPVPQAHAITLIPASSISSVAFSAWGLVMPRAFARVRARGQHQIFRHSSIVDLSSLVHSGLVPTQARFLVPSLRSLQLFSSDHQLWIVHKASQGAFQKILDHSCSTT